MIDFMNDGLNGSNGKNNDSYIPCPACADYEHVKEALSGAALYTGQDPLEILHILVAELKMWRSKDELDKRTKAAIGQMVEQKIKNGFQVDSEI